ncbi:Rrf2 family transcriptional regulator [Burkholderia gladioli]|uniref:Rrf2 family transcriptional regulator n=1 Tax=Burkholderia gladioli TaxID=28095 RepID=UPI00163F9C4C|nr:Rrf2 family transcriptional regulator [Burkholderia gladioli]
MRLTDYTDYSLRVMLFLAVRSEGLSTIQEISDAYGISKNHLMKVVQRLGELGWVDTVRGRNGGLRINANSGRLTIGEVVRATESDFALVGCFGGEGQGVEHRSCVIEPHCRLKGVLYAAREAFFSELDRHTISELSRPASPLAAALGIVPIVVEPA